MLGDYNIKSRLEISLPHDNYLRAENYIGVILTVFIMQDLLDIFINKILQLW